MISVCVILLVTGNAWPLDKKLDELVAEPYLCPHRDVYAGPVKDDVRIDFIGAYMPLDRFILIRKKNEACALKFVKFWNEKEGRTTERYASYISYYQNDGSGNFSNQNVKITEGQASNLPRRGWTRLFTWQPGTTYVKCGPLKMAWEYYGGVAVIEDGDSPKDYGYEFAPTPWNNIGDVNISDRRIRWYRYDKSRKPIDIPVNKLWE